jgi:sugar lactone lactonase YvrE
MGHLIGLGILLVVAACAPSQDGFLPAASRAGSMGSAFAGPRLPAALAHPQLNASDALLYVADEADSTVTVYDLDESAAPVATIATGVSSPEVVSVDRHGTLYVGNNSGSTVTEYPFGSTTPSLTLSASGTSPSGVAALPDGTVYVCGRGAPLIYVYPAGATTPSRTLTGGPIMSPSQLVLDSKRDLYVVDNDDGVYVIPAGSTHPAQLNLDNLTSATGIALDEKADRMYVSTVGNNNHYVDEYKIGWPTQLLHLASVDADNIAFGGGAYSDLFVPDFFGFDVQVYKAKGKAPFESLSVTYNSQSIAFKPAGVP